MPIGIYQRHPSPPEPRFWSKVNKNGPNGCWIWTGTIGGRGYGLFKLKGRNIYAHRFAYELLLEPIPKGSPLDHLCRNPTCVNPTHLELVTTWQNTLRGIGPFAKKALAVHCVHGHLFDLLNTYYRPSRGNRECRRCKNISSEIAKKHSRFRLSLPLGAYRNEEIEIADNRLLDAIEICQEVLAILKGRRELLEEWRAKFDSACRASITKRNSAHEPL